MATPRERNHNPQVKVRFEPRERQKRKVPGVIYACMYYVLHDLLVLSREWGNGWEWEDYLLFIIGNFLIPC